MTPEQKKYVEYLRRSCNNGVAYANIEIANQQKLLREYGKELKLTSQQMNAAVKEAMMEE